MKKKEVKTIRLTKYELKAIKETAKEVFENKAKVWLFGSRVNPNAKGGDIDIYIEVPDTKNRLDKKITYLVKLKSKIGDQKIDLVLKPYNCQEEICVEAKKQG